MSSSDIDFSVLEERIGYVFKDEEVLRTALRHKSALEGRDGSCNDKLEWLGDAVVGFFVADYLFHHYDKPRSWLSLAKSKLVSEECLAYLARKIELARFIELGKGEERSGGREKDSILASSLEALAGAVFVDSSSYEETRKVLKLIFCEAGDISSLNLSVNYKGLLQRWCLQYYNCLPRYETLSQGNQDFYRVEVKIGENSIAWGEGKNKKRAEQEAARKALEVLSSGDQFPNKGQ